MSCPSVLARTARNREVSRLRYLRPRALGNCDCSVASCIWPFWKRQTAAERGDKATSERGEENEEERIAEE